MNKQTRGQLLPVFFRLGMLVVLAGSGMALANPDIVIDESWELVIDQAGDGEVRRGDTVEFELSVTNQGSGNALAVEIDNALHEHLDLDTASIEISPIAVDDDYPDVPGNTTFSVAAGDGLLANDRALYPVGGTPPGLTVDVAASDSNTAQGGSVTLNTDGSFEYTPPTGYEGPDSFNYTLVNDHGLTDTATVHLQVTEPVLYVSNSSSTGIAACDNADYPDIQAAIDAANDDDEIRVCAGNGAYEQDQTLLVSEGVVLLGEPAWRGAGSRPTIRAGGDHDEDSPLVELFDGTHIEGFEFRAIAEDTIYAFEKANILIRGNRFTTDLDELRWAIRFWTSNAATNSGWVAVLDNEFDMNSVDVEQVVRLRAWNQSAYEFRFAGNHYSGGKGYRFLYISTLHEGSVTSEIRDNQIVDAVGDVGSGGSRQVVDVTAFGDGASMSTLFEGNHIRASATSSANDEWFDLVKFDVNADNEHCVVLNNNDLQLQDSGFDDDDVTEYFFASDDTESLFLEELDDGTFETLKQFVRDQDANGEDVRVLTIMGTEFPGPEGTVSPAPDNCARIENLPEFD